MGYIDPAEAEENLYRQFARQTAATDGRKPNGRHKHRGDSNLRTWYSKPFTRR